MSTSSSTDVNSQSIATDELNRLLGLANFLPQMTWTCNTEGVCDFINHRWEEYTGCKTDHLLGSGWLAYVHPDDSPLLVKQWSHCVATGEDFVTKFRIRDQHGQYRMFDTRAKAMKDSNGRVLRWFGSNTDIQTSLDFEQALQTEKQRLKQELDHRLLENRKTLYTLTIASQATGLGTWEYDVTQDLIVSDARCDELLGLIGNEVNEVNSQATINAWTANIYASDQSIFASALNKSLKEHSPLAVSFRVRQSDSRLAWVKCDATPIIEDNAIVRLIGCLQDVTEERYIKQKLELTNRDLTAALAKAKQAAKAKSTFLANMSHEIRTPMNGIIGMLSLLRETPMQHQQKTFVRKAHQAAERLLSILNDILDISRIESDNFKIVTKACPLEQLIQESVDIFNSSAMQKGIELHVEVSPATPKMLITDSLRVGQIISNLVGNAVKFTPAEGNVSVIFKTKRDLERDTLLLIIDVVDSGIGISTSDQKRIFEAFAQGDESTTRRFGGTGLGLAICHKLATHLGGEIRLVSKLGSGSKFSVRIPVTLPYISDSDERNIPAIFVLDEQPDLYQELAALQLNTELTLRSIASPLDINKDEYVQSTSSKNCILIVDARNQTARYATQYKHIVEQLQRNANYFFQIIFVVPQRLNVEVRNELTSIGAEILYTPLNSAVVEGLIEQFSQTDILTKHHVPAQIDFSHLKLLSVDDMAINNEIVRGMLEPLGITVTTAHSGNEAVRNIIEHHYDIVLMDVHMDQLNGLDATRKIRSMREIKQPLIFGLSASILEEDRKAGLEVGMDEYLGKPFHVDEFVGVLSKFIDGPTSVNADQSIPLAVALPDFIDTDEAMQRFNQNSELLVRCIRSFVSSFQGKGKKLRKLVDEQDFTGARQFAHRVHGAANYMANKPIIALAEKVEEELKNNKVDHVGEFITLLESQIEQLLGVVNADLPSQHQAISETELQELVSSMLIKVSKHRFVSPDQWEVAVSALDARDKGAQARELRKAMETFDFELAKRILSSLASMSPANKFD